MRLEIRKSCQWGELKRKQMRVIVEFVSSTFLSGANLRSEEGFGSLTGFLFIRSLFFGDQLLFI
jgi:hypothetical protein